MLYITCINLLVKSRIFNFQTTLPMRFLEDFASFFFSGKKDVLYTQARFSKEFNAFFCSLIGV